MANDRIGGGEELERFRAALSRRFGEKVYMSWMADLEMEDKSDGCVTLSTESDFKRDAIGQRFIVVMKDTWSESVAPIRRLRVVTRRRLIEDSKRVEERRPGAVGEAAPRVNGRDHAAAKNGFDKSLPTLDAIAAPVDAAMTFESFAVDETNSLAFAAVQQVFLEGAPSEVIYLCGPSGVGKSHLLFAVANAHELRIGPGRCAYLTYAGLKSGCVDAVWSKTTLALQRELLAKDVLLLDDIHFLDTSPRTQAELLNFLNAAMASRKRLVIAGELTPAKLAEAGFNRSLTDRLAGGLAVALRPGDAAHRERVLRKRLEMQPPNVRIEDDAVAYVAETFTNSLRETIGAMKQLILEYSGKGVSVGRREAAAALRARLFDARKKPTFAETAAATAAAFGLTDAEFMGRGQAQRLVRARHVFSIICREDLKESFPQIARFLARDHTTIMSGFKRGQALIERDKALQALLSRIREGLGLSPG
jgi:chromosomal replication initiator protein